MSQKKKTVIIADRSNGIKPPILQVGWMSVPGLLLATKLRGNHNFLAISTQNYTKLDKIDI